jgi:hypothetical protein
MVFSSGVCRDKKSAWLSINWFLKSWRAHKIAVPCIILKSAPFSTILDCSCSTRFKMRSPSFWQPRRSKLKRRNTRSSCTKSSICDSNLIFEAGATERPTHFKTFNWRLFPAFVKVSCGRKRNL